LTKIEGSGPRELNDEAAALRSAALRSLIGRALVLEALKILEDAVLDSLERAADTPAVREALDLLERFVFPEYPIRDFREGLFLTTAAHSQ
jgi:hypothetical protein